MFPWRTPLIWNEDTSRLVGGHQRLTVLRDMGISEVEVSIVHLDEPQEKALNVAMNKISGAWDNDALAALLRILDTDMALLTGFSDLDMESLLGVKKTKDKSAGAAEDLPIISRLGDIWMMEAHRLMCGDSTVQADMDRLMYGQPARMVITDPPNNVAYEPNPPSCWAAAITNGGMSRSCMAKSQMARLSCSVPSTTAANAQCGPGGALTNLQSRVT